MLFHRCAENISKLYFSSGFLFTRCSKYPQLYSRIGFAHWYRASTQEEMRFMLSRYWERLDLKMNSNDFTDAEARGY
jgi:hypothetical protein